jgi:translation initiation factor IF-3
MDYGKFKYEQTKKERDSRKSQKSVVVKEVRFSPKIDEHDIDTKTRMAKRFLDEGNKVKLTVKFKGRELAHTNLGRDLLQQVQMLLGDNVIVEAPSKMEGKSMTMMVSLKPPKGGIAKPKPQAEAEDRPVSPTAPPSAEAPTAEPPTAEPPAAEAPTAEVVKVAEPVVAGASQAAS